MMEDRELRVKQLFEETITIPIEKYDELQRKAGILEHFKTAYPGMFGEKLYIEDDDQNEVFETEVIDE